MSVVKRSKTQESAVPGVVQTIDIQAIDASYARRVHEQMNHPEVHFERLGDGVDWARKIMARIAAGEKLPIISEQFAKEALVLVEKQPEAPPLRENEREPGEDVEEHEPNPVEP